jgi:CheY-like chemotaxis protein
MSSRHSALIVEDDEENATDLSQLVSAIGCDSVRTDNHRDALTLIEEQRFCLVLLDLEIKESPDSIKGHKVHGSRLIEAVRRRYGLNKRSLFWTPILVITAHGKEGPGVERMMRDGADHVIGKPLDLADIETRIRTALEEAGRPTHDACISATSKAEEKARFVLRITGERRGKRAVITLANRKIELTKGALFVLLHLAIARLQGGVVSNVTLGAKQHEGFRPVSRLREQLQPSGEYANIVTNDRHGGYTLKAEVTVAECDADGLKWLCDQELSDLAAKLAALLARGAA